MTSYAAAVEALSEAGGKSASQHFVSLNLVLPESF